MAKNLCRYRILFFTQDNCYRKEADDLNELVKLTGDNLHLYKPKASTDEVHQLLEQLAPETVSKIVLHHHKCLISRFPVKGIHTASGENITENTVSKSIKTIQPYPKENLEKPLDYYFFSPVFTSLSKKNHHPKFTIEQINAWVATQTQPIIALGGLNAKNIHQLTGFSGFAFKGAIWNAADPLAAAYDLIKGICHEC